MTTGYPARRLAPLNQHFFSTLDDRIASMQADGCDVIRLDVGSPDLPPAPHIIQALSRASALPDRHGYQPYRGTAALRQAWAELYAREYAVRLEPETEVMPLLGSKEGLFHLSLALLDPGDVVLIPDPGYMTYTRSALIAGGQPYYLPLRPENGFLPDFEAVPSEIARQAKMLWMNYPNNPTAAVAGPEFFTRAVAFAREYGLLLCHDAAYAQVTYDGYDAPSLLQVPGARQVAVEFNTLSKSHNMAGWRVGVAVGETEALRSLYALKTNVDSGHFLPVWEAAVVAMTGDQSWLEERNQVYQRRRDRLIQALHSLGLRAAIPCASLYIWCPVPDGWTSADFAQDLLAGAFVSLTPGTVFGQGGEGYVRISLTSPEERLAEAMDRLAKWMKGRKTGG